MVVNAEPYHAYGSNTALRATAQNISKLSGCDLANDPFWSGHFSCRHLLLISRRETRPAMLSNILNNQSCLCCCGPSLDFISPYSLHYATLDFIHASNADFCASMSPPVVVVRQHTGPHHNGEAFGRLFGVQVVRHGML